MSEYKKFYRGIGIMVCAGIVILPLLYWFFFRQVPIISVPEARVLLANAPQDTIIVDVRSPQEYLSIHIKDSFNLPFNQLDSYLFEPTFTTLSDKKHILVICNMGISSSFAVKKMQQLGLAGARSIDGGMDAWRTGETLPGQACCLVRNKVQQRDNIPVVRYSLVEKLAISITGFGVKIFYELLALVVIFLLWKKTAPEWVAIRRAMMAFFIGENACAVNYLFFDARSNLWEFFHSYGMMVCFGLFLYAVMKMVDWRFFKFTPPQEKCLLLPYCKKCYKYLEVSCTLRQMFLFVIPASAVLTFMLFSAPIGSSFFTGNIFGTWVIFGHATIQQLFEVRFCPVMALIFFTISFGVLWFRKESGFEVSKVFFALGLGPLMFGLMRFLIYWGYSANPLWADVWEEMTELLFISFVMFLVLQARRLEKR